MERVSVSSSNVAAVGYDEAERILEVEFNSGSVYQYFNVPKEVYEDMVSASSVGKYFNSYVRNRYSYS